MLRAWLHDHERALARPVGNARRSWTERSSCVLRLENEAGLCGFGEAAPLPGYSLDTLSECRTALEGLDLSGIPARLEQPETLLAELGRASRRVPRALPAARAALECALLDLWAQCAGEPAWALLRGAASDRPEPRAVAALLMAEPEQALDEARAAFARGIRTLKFKIGRAGARAQELSAIAELCAELGTTGKLRLDANRALSRADAALYGALFRCEGLEFLEEPSSAGDRPSFSELGVRVALDESLAEIEPGTAEARALLTSGVRALILKPTLLGGISACVAWAKLAETARVDVILSHAFDGPLGLALSAALSLSIGSKSQAHGLDLEGARIDPSRLAFYSPTAIQPWPAPGLGCTDPLA